MTAQPADGTAIILHLIEAARAIVRRPNYGLSNLFDPEGRDLQRWTAELEARYAREKHEAEPVGWEPRTWGELKPGDRVSLGGVEAVIEAVIVLRWHVSETEYAWHPGPGHGEESDGCRACGGRCRESRGRKYAALEHAYVAVKLEGRDAVYKMPPGGEVETLRGQEGQAADEATGYRSPLHEEPIDVMREWARDAALTLEGAGLGPVEVIRP